MPASVDLGRAVRVTHSPVARLDQTLPPMPKPDLAKMFREILEGLKDLTGVDLSILADVITGLQNGLGGLRQFIESLIGQGLDLLNLPSPEQAWQQIMSTFLNPLSWLTNIPIGAITGIVPMPSSCVRRIASIAPQPADQSRTSSRAARCSSMIVAGTADNTASSLGGTKHSVAY